MYKKPLYQLHVFVYIFAEFQMIRIHKAISWWSCGRQFFVKLISSIGISTWLYLNHNISKIQEKMSSIEAFCIVSSSIFGVCIRDANDINSKTSEKMVLLVVFISGSLFYYTYCGFLTSSLAVPNEKLPFDSPEGLLNTNYK